MKAFPFIMRRFLPTLVVVGALVHFGAIAVGVPSGSNWWSIEPWLLIAVFYFVVIGFVIQGRQHSSKSAGKR